MIFYIINTIIKNNYIIYDHLQWTLSVSIYQIVLIVMIMMKFMELIEYNSENKNYVKNINLIVKK